MGATYLAVARLRKPHGLKGDAVVWVLTDQPESVLAVGRELTPLDESGEPLGPALAIERSRPYHRQWLVKFRDIEDRGVLEQWRSRVFGVSSAELDPPRNDELYLHEIPGAAIVVDGCEIGVAVALHDGPGGGLLAIEVGGREVYVPFRRPIVRNVDRGARRIELDPPPGLLEL